MRQVIYAWNYLEWGGAQIHLFAIIREVSKTYDVVVVLPRGSDRQLLRFMDELGVRREFFEPAADLSPAGSLFAKIRKHGRKIKSEYAMLRKIEEQGLEDSIVHVELGPWQSLFALVWLSLRTHTFITMHNSLGNVSPLRRLLWKTKLRVISRFRTFHAFASNEDSKNYFRGLYSAEKFRQIPVTYTSVDPLEIETALAEPSDPGALHRKHSLPEEAFLVFCVGQFIDRKGRWVFLEAAREFAEYDKEAVFVWIANSRPPEADLERAAAYGLGDRFRFITSDEVGPEHIDLIRLLRLADLFALVSFQEGLPISLLEAMALGIPSVSTRVNAIPEAVRHEETGLLIEPGDASALAAAFRRLAADPELRRELGEAGRELVLEKFNDRAVARLALETYRKHTD